MSTVQSREERVIEHLTELATGFVMASRSYSMREAEGHADMYEKLAISYSAKASGLIIAIAYLRGVTPGEVDNEIETALAEPVDV